jgi:hypothetical protein
MRFAFPKRLSGLSFCQETGDIVCGPAIRGDQFRRETRPPMIIKLYQAEGFPRGTQRDKGDGLVACTVTKENPDRPLAGYRQPHTPTSASGGPG